MLASGLAHVLQGHSVFPEMTVAENVLLGGYTLRDRAVRDDRARFVRDLWLPPNEHGVELAGRGGVVLCAAWFRRRRRRC